MRYLILGLVMLASVASLAQVPPCQFVEDEVDEFTKQREVRNNVRMQLRSYHTFSWGFQYVDGTLTLRLRWTDSSLDPMQVNDRLYFKLMNDSIVLLQAQQVSARDYSNKLWTVVVYYSISKEQIEQLAATRVKKCRIYTMDTYDQFDWSDRRQNRERFRQAAQCFLEKLATLP